MNEVEILQQKLETALDIIMEHFHENEERMEQLEERLEKLERGVLQNVDE